MHVRTPIFEAGEWRIRSNMEIHQISKGEDLTIEEHKMDRARRGSVRERMPKRLLHGHIIEV